MTFFQAALLGFVQGATEFIPVSSSAHLVLVPWLLGWKVEPQTAFIFDVLVQCGTLVAVIVYFRRELAAISVAAARSLAGRHSPADPRARLAWLILAASLPAFVLGMVFKNLVASTFERPGVVSAFLLVTSALLFLSERLGRRRRGMQELRLSDALWIGAAQALSLFPGVSRSGATIAGGLTRNLTRPDAARFSFLMAVPVMLGAGVAALADLVAVGDGLRQGPALLVGFATAAVVGWFAIRWLLGFLAQRSLTVFAYYCLVVGASGLLIHAIRG